MKRIITDMPGLVGYRDGLNTGYGDRAYRESQLPEKQQPVYRQKFKLGFREGVKDAEDLNQEDEDA